LLHEQHAVALWSSLEAFIKTFVAEWLNNVEGAWQKDVVQNLKIRIGDYESLSPADKCLWIVDQIDQSVSGPLRNGINRFEALLQPFDMDGNLPDEYKKALYELSQLRHVIVHRSGKADRRLLSACPWLKLQLNERIKVSHQMWGIYSLATIEYIIELTQRVREQHGLDRRYDPKFP